MFHASKQKHKNMNMISHTSNPVILVLLLNGDLSSNTSMGLGADARLHFKQLSPEAVGWTTEDLCL